MYGIPLNVLISKSQLRRTSSQETRRLCFDQLPHTFESTIKNQLAYYMGDSTKSDDFLFQAILNALKIVII